MKKTVLPILTMLLLAACGETASSSSGDAFIGIWKNPNQPTTPTPQGQADFVIDDRILIEPKQGGGYSVSVLARGVFTEMSFDNGLLCTKSADRACFKLQDADTLVIGSEIGLITYKRMK